VPKSKDWERDAKWADIVVFDDTLGHGAKAQALRATGKPVIGGSPYTDSLEDDRSFGQEELKKAGVNIIPYKDFDSFDPAIEFVKRNPDRYVIKPSGEAQNVKRRLFVGEEEDGEDVVRMLEAYKRAFSDEINVFQLQRRVLRGVGVIAVGPTPAATASTTASAAILALFMLSSPAAPSTKVNIFSLSATAISDYIACDRQGAST
jgi:phosphoribosylamine--glycine ligase